MAWINTSHVKSHVKPPPPTTTHHPPAPTTHQYHPFLPFVICDHRIGAVEVPENMKMGTEGQEVAGSKLAPGLQRR